MVFHEDLPRLGEKENLKGRKQSKAVESFAWNITVLKVKGVSFSFPPSNSLEYLDNAFTLFLDEREKGFCCFEILSCKVVWPYKYSVCAVDFWNEQVLVGFCRLEINVSVSFDVYAVYGLKDYAIAFTLHLGL